MRKKGITEEVEKEDVSEREEIGEEEEQEMDDDEDPNSNNMGGMPTRKSLTVFLFFTKCNQQTNADRAGARPKQKTATSRQHLTDCLAD